MPDETHWMSAALEEAGKAFDEHEVPVGCAVVFNNRIVGKGHNLMEKRGNPFAHAEMVALGNALQSIGRWSLSECSVYVTVEPCAMCMGAMLLARVPKVVYGTEEPETGACGSVLAIADEPALKHRIVVIGGVEREKCRQLLTEFFKLRRRGVDPEHS
jgi:tRNA(adenine34) deaminase